MKFLRLLKKTEFYSMNYNLPKNLRHTSVIDEMYVFPRA